MVENILVKTLVRGFTASVEFSSMNENVLVSQNNGISARKPTRRRRLPTEKGRKGEKASPLNYEIIKVFKAASSLSNLPHFIMYTSIAAVESLGFEHVSHEMCWSKEYIELRPRVTQRQRYDKLQELCQHLDAKLRERKRETKKLKLENETLREENETLKKQARDDNMAMLSFAPLALHEAGDSSLRHAGFMLPKFSGTDPTNFAEVWMKIITSSAELFSWSENQTFMAAKMALEGEARHWLIALRRDISNFEDFKVAFTNKYQKKTSVAKVHLELAKRKKLKGEALNEFVGDVKHLAEKIDLSDEDTLQYVVLGLVDDEMTKKKVERMSTLDELDDYLMELANDEVRVPDLVVSCRKKGSAEDCKKVCYHCKKVGHVYTECQEYVESNVLALFVIAALFAVMGV